MAKKPREYLLGTHDAEAERLGLQHRLWSAWAFACWERAGVRPGRVVLDIGCGPGYGTLDLAQLVAPGGRVIAVDESERFVELLTAHARCLGIANVEASVQDVRDLDIGTAAVDVAYARWLFCFLPAPDAVLAALARGVRPGGVLAVQDYVDWAGLALSPESDVFQKVIRATSENWRASGGDQRIVRRLPALMARHGFRVEAIRPMQRVARPRDALWEWPASFFANFVPLLVARGLLTSRDQDEFAREWAERTSDENAFFWTPPMAEILARRL